MSGKGRYSPPPSPTPVAHAVEVPSKRIRCQEPDVIVTVGSDEDMQEFKCYGVVLSLASEHFNTILGNAMEKSENRSRVEFPDKDPAEWKLFYSFIDPSTNRMADVTKDNVHVLLPWFNEFGMQDLMTECDQVLCNCLPNGCNDCRRTSSVDTQEYWSDLNKGIDRKSALGTALNFLPLINQYPLPLLDEAVHRTIVLALLYGYDVIVFEHVKKIMPLIKKAENAGGTDSKLRELWIAVQSCLNPAFDHPIDHIPITSDLLPQLLYSCLQRKTEKKKNDMLKTKIQFVIDSLPNQLSEAMAHGSCSEAKVEVRKLLHNMLNGSEGISISEGYELDLDA